MLAAFPALFMFPAQESEESLHGFMICVVCVCVCVCEGE